MILIINCGSSTIKYQLYTPDVEQVVVKGIVARIAEDGSYIEQITQRGKVEQEIPIASHHEAFDVMMQYLLHHQYGAIPDIKQILAVGHRAVHGADIFIQSTRITADVIRKMEECIPLAPLHNPPNLVGIKEAMALLPDVPHVAVFDTAFNQTMPSCAYTYAIPYELYRDHKIRRYGFHGTSCRYVSQQAARFLNRPLADLNTVVCHLGNGVTITAVKGGKAVDSSIGFATFSGVMMGTRSGDIDPGLIFYLHKDLGYSLQQIEDMLYKQSGLLGVSGVSNDMRVVVRHAEEGNERCQLALEMFAYMTKKYIGGYAAAMGGMNTLIFTAGIGENSPIIRQMTCAGLEFLGVSLDEAVNRQPMRAETLISRPGSACAVLVVPTNEEKMIALDTLAIAGNG